MPDRLGCDKVAATLTCEIRSQPLSVKNQEKGGSARASPMAAPMPKSVSLLEKIDTAKKKNNITYVYAYKSAYLSSLEWPCIYSRCPTGWIMTGIYSHWMRYFPYCQP